MKKSFALVLTIILVATFSYLITFIYETKALSAKNTQNQYLYIQAKNHMEFLKEYVNSIDIENTNHLIIDDNSFLIEANMEKKDSNYKLELIVESKKENIRLINTLIK
jgi:hypothetical protein